MPNQARKSLTLFSQLLEFQLPDIQINRLQLDSRLAAAGDVFIAVKGQFHDARDYINQAISDGVSAVLIETEQVTNHGNIDWRGECPLIYVYQLNQLENRLAHCFYQADIAALCLVGITGTNGKTTTAELIYQAFSHFNHIKAAYIGTLGIKSTFAEKLNPNTTPVGITLYAELAQLQQQGITHVVLEVSSHAIAEGRIFGLQFHTLAFSNLSHDHLDYHHDMANYFAVKTSLFTDYEHQFAVINRDSQWGRKLTQQLESLPAHSAPLICVSRKAAAELSCQNETIKTDGFVLNIEHKNQQVELVLPLLAEFNIDNALLALGCLIQQSGIEFSAAVSAISQVKHIAGRMEVFSAIKKATVIVDFAHTPAGLNQALSACRQHTDPSLSAQLWLVFGCGGDRDKEKRPLMAAVASQFADVVVVTSDNPRTESAEAIIQDVLVGIDKQKTHYTIIDRKKAIAFALSHANSQDLVLIAGKGHETYQEINGIQHDYNERDYVAKLLGMAA